MFWSILAPGTGVAKSDSKFGTFGGVFTPSILTILGVIMYLRLPWMVGNGGVATSLLLIIAAHTVSMCTGLSISSIATDKSVGAGGPYYIISRSLGLPIGGAIGIALFLGLSFSISLYVIGFSESFLAVIGVEASANAIRVCGTITIVLLTVITFISTSLAIKTQYVILLFIGLSLLAIFLGSPGDLPALTLTAEQATEAKPDNAFVLFAVFFPAVTGFTAGVNMSGDLRDPKSAIPRGTMAAIVVGLVVYVALTIFLGTTVSEEQLRFNPRVLEDLSVWAPAVTAGIWGATLSSALGSILGAPRILQTVSADGITPRFFAKGYGKTNEPRNALLLAFLIGWGGVLIASLDAIAGIVSIVFMTTYGVLNLAAAIESVASPDFRPEFRIPTFVSWVGAISCVVLMILMDIVPMVFATAAMAGLYVYLQRRQLQLDAGDAWEGVWSTLVRAGLHRLARSARQQRNWHPNILLFRPDDGEPRIALRQAANSLITGNGMLTDIRLRGEGDKGTGAEEEGPLLDSGPVVGVFSRVVTTDEPYETIHSLAAHHGYAGIEPNTVLLDWDAYAEDPERLASLVDRLREEDLNTLLFSDATHEAKDDRVDVWWRADSSPTLGIALVRFITRSAAYRRHRIRFLTVSRDSSLNDGLRNAARRMLEEARVEGDVEVILDTVDPRSTEEHAAERSADAKLAILELPTGPLAPHVEALGELTEAIPSVLFVVPSSMFASVGRVVRAARRAEEDESEPLDVALEELRLPEIDALAHHTESFAERLEATLDDLYQECVTPLGARNRELLERTASLMNRHFGQLEKGLDTSNPIKQRRTANRVQSAFLMESGKLIEEFAEQGLADQRDILEGRLRAFIDDDTLVVSAETVEVERPRADFAPEAGDSRELARLKSRRRGRAVDDVIRYQQPTASLIRWYVERAMVEAASDTIRAFVTDSWNLAIQLIKIFNSSRTSLTLIHGLPSAEAVAAFLEGERKSAESQVDGLLERHEARIAELRELLAEDARGLSQRYADDLARPDLPIFIEARRKLEPRRRDGLRKELVEEATVFYDNQRALLERALVGLKVSAFQHRLATIVERTRESIALEVKNGVLSGCVELEGVLREFLESESTEPLKINVDLSHRLDPPAIVQGFARDAQRSSDELPESIETLSDQSIQELSEGEPDEVALEDLPLRRLAQFLVDSELAAPLTELLSSVPPIEERAVRVAEDVIRLVGFHQNEFEPEESEDGFHAHMRPVVESSLERLVREREALDELTPRVGETLGTRLAAVLSGTDVYELTGSAQALGQHIRRHHGQRAISGAQSLALRAVERLRKALVGAVYGQSAGLLMARRLRDQGDSRGALVDVVLRFVEEQSPRPGVLEDLPFYYRQLFFGKNTFNETFWVERENEIVAARRGITQHERGGRGVLVITGEPDSGKTALCRRLTSRALSGRPTFWVEPPEAGDASVESFRARLAEATGERGSVKDILGALPEKSVVVIEDLELFWERSEKGLAVIDMLLSQIEAHSSRLLFVIDVGAHPFEIINRFRPLADHALAVVECGPLPAETLKEIVMLRHGSTGVGFELDGMAESELTEWRLAQLFSRHFGASRGLVGSALVSWITNVEEASEESIGIRAPARKGWEVLDRLRPEWVAVIVQLLLHKRMSHERLLRVSGLDGMELDQQLDVLRRMGLVRESRQGVLRLDRFVTPALIERLRERRVIP